MLRAVLLCFIDKTARSSHTFQFSGILMNLAIQVTVYIRFIYSQQFEISRLSFKFNHKSCYPSNFARISLE